MFNVVKWSITPLLYVKKHLLLHCNKRRQVAETRIFTGFQRHVLVRATLRSQIGLLYRTKPAPLPAISTQVSILQAL
jgi:hypothetical protein